MKKLVTAVTLLAGAVAVYSQGVVNYTDYNAGTQGFNIHVYSPNPANPGVEQTGNSTLAFGTGGAALYGDAPVGGMASYGGVVIGDSAWSAGAVAQDPAPGTAASGYVDGANFTAELYAAAGTVTTFSTATFSAIPSTAAALGGDAVYGGYGPGYGGIYFGSGNGLVQFGGTGGTAGAPTVALGSAVSLAIACWYNAGGTVNDLATAIADKYVSGASSVGVENTWAGGAATVPLMPGIGDAQTLAGGIGSFSLTTTVPEPSTIALGVIGASAFLMRLRRKQ